MATEQAREKLLDFLDRRVFDPVIRKNEDDFSDERAKQKFADVKRSTENEKRRFHDNYRSAEEVRDNFMDDLSSSAGEKKQQELEQLGLPMLPDVRDEFLKLCDDLGVRH